MKLNSVGFKCNSCLHVLQFHDLVFKGIAYSANS